MLARRIELDISEKHDFIVLFGVKLCDEDVFGALVVTAKEFFPRANDSGWSLFQSFAIRIFANSTQQLANQLLGIHILQQRPCTTVPGNRFLIFGNLRRWVVAISGRGLLEEGAGIHRSIHNPKKNSGSKK